MKLDDLPAHLTPAPTLAEMPAPAQATAVVLQLQAVAFNERRFDAAATAVLADLAGRLACTRVALAVRRGPALPAEVLASSDGIDHDGRSAAIRALSDAADEALERRAAVLAPSPEDGRSPVSVAHAALLRGGDVRAAMGVPFEVLGGMNGVLLFEMRDEPDPSAQQLAQDAAWFVGPLLLLQARADESAGERLSRWWRRELDHTQRHRLPTPAIVGLMVTVGILAAVLWPSTRHVVSQARIEGYGQRVVPAPMDGFLQSVAVRPGEAVKAGQVLATLDDREAALDAERAGAERAQHERQYMDALTREDAAAAEIARARFEQAKAQDDLARARLARARLLAPFDGVLISGDLSSAVGSPVRRGQELMVVAPSQSWRVVAEVDESDVAAVGPGQKARVLLAALDGGSLEFAVERVSPVAQPVDGRNVFEAEGRVQQDQPGLRPGLRGIARIEAGEHPPLAVWWERASHALRRLWWTVLA